MPHTTCPDCGSLDNLFVYPDGHEHCFTPGCGRHTKPCTSDEKPTTVVERKRGGLIPIDVQALPKRGLTEETAQHFGVGYGEYRGEKCMVFPYCDAKGRPVAQKLRFAGKRFEVVGDAKKMGLFGAHLWRDGGKSVVITEGEIDCASFSQAQGNKWPVVSIPNGAQSALAACKASLEWLEGFEKVVLAFDADEPGQLAAAEVAALLSPGKARIVHWPAGIKDANDLVVAGRSAEIVDCFWSARPWRPDGLVLGDALWERLLLKDDANAIPLPHSGVQKMTRGLRPGEILVLVAGTGAGKSTACKEWAAEFARRGVKLGYIGLEEGVRTSAIGLLGVLTSRRLLFEEHFDPRESDIRTAFETIKDRVVFYDHFGSLGTDHLLAKIRFMVKGEGCRVIFLDHLSIVVSGLDGDADERKQVDRMMTKLASLAQETQCAIVAVSHLSRKEGTPHEEGRKITLADIRSSHGIAQLGHTIVAIERDQQADTDDERDRSTVRILKCRWTGSTGEAGFLRYHPDTGRQLEDADPELTAADLPAADEQGTL